MPFNGVYTLRTRLSLGALNLFVRVANRSTRGATRVGQTESVARILVLELWNIGDVILAMPFLAQLRRVFPYAKITLLGRPFAADLMAGTGLVDEFIVTDLTWTVGHRTRALKRAIDLWRVSGKLRARKFDVAFSSRLHVREHVLLALSGAKRRVGFALSERYVELTDAIAAGDARLHKAEEWMRLLEPFGGAASAQAPRLHVHESERLWAKGYLASRGIPNEGLLIGIHPGASLAEKRWPIERFGEVAAATAAQPGLRVLAFAEPSGYGSATFAIPGVIGAQVGLRELIALIGQCDLLVCNDSGPMHIAAALAVPTVAMFGSGIDDWFAPLGEGHEILRSEPETSSTVRSARGEEIRTPSGISTLQVNAAVARAVQRLRARGKFSAV